MNKVSLVCVVVCCVVCLVVGLVVGWGLGIGELYRPYQSGFKVVLP